MTLRPPEDIVAGRPDGAVAFAGDEGNLMLQDGAKAVFRGGVTADTGDFDVYQHDLVGDGDLIIPLDDVGGASLVNAALVSFGDSGQGAYTDDPAANPTDASRPFTARVEDLTKDADVLDPDPEDILIARVPEPVDGVEQGRLSAGIFSDNGRIVIEHDGLDTGENIINGSFNVQSGSTDAVQIRGPDGTLADPDNSDTLDALTDVFESGLDALAAANTEFSEAVSLNRTLQDAPYELARLDTGSSSHVSITIETDDGAGNNLSDVAFEIQTRPTTDAPWFGGWRSYTSGSVRQVFETGSRFVRVMCTSESATDGAVADVAIEGSG